MRGPFDVPDVDSTSPENSSAALDAQAPSPTSGPTPSAPPPALLVRGERLRAEIGGSFPFASRYLRVPRPGPAGAWMHVVDEGPRVPSALVCVHGNPTWSFYFRSILERLRQQRRVIAVDHIGMGLSEQPVGRALRLADHSANLGAALDQLGVERALLFVHDWGGPIGLSWARSHPERLTGLIVSNTAAFRSRGVPLRIRLARSEIVGAPAILSANAFARGLVAMGSARPLAREARRAYLAPGETRGGREAQYAFVRDIPLAPSDPSWEELAAIERFLPTLLSRPAIVLWGERDWCFTRRYRAEWERRLPWAPSTFFSGAGHLLLEDEPSSVAALVQHFVVQRAGT